MRTAIIGGALLIVGIVAVVLRVEPFGAVVALWNRVWPILLFVAAITVVTELVAEADVFTMVAERLSRWGRGRAWMLWLLVCALCVGSTVFFSLDTTAVLITPVVITVVRHTGVRILPFALTAVWLANTASLLLPVSNLTNLLAQEVGHQSVTQFVALSWAPALVAILVPLAVVAIAFRRDLNARFAAPTNARLGDRKLFTISIVVLVALLPALVSGIPVWIPACAAALVLAVAFALLRPAAIRIGLIPWSLLAFAGGLFLVAGAAHQLGLGRALAAATGDGTGFPALLRLAGVGAASANLVNNLPAYLALEPTAAGYPVRVIALLVGVNCGVLITPWASLATLLWHNRLNALGVDVPWRRFVLLGLIVAPLTIIGSVTALAFVS
ncbi:MAG: arsenic transporter [Microbacteriaceae bacterium]|nr:MAG: arsenic transporter [Microbacteriaceae bacterium]